MHLPNLLAQLFARTQTQACIHLLVSKAELDLHSRSTAFDSQFLLDKIQDTQQTLKRLPKGVEFVISVEGYNDDPRDLHEIEEVRNFVSAWAFMTDILRHPALSEMSRTFITRCIGLPQ
jgi:hypothetical protein